jgi:predicted phage terminase large subunit-like protein
MMMLGNERLAELIENVGLPRTYARALRQMEVREERRRQRHSLKAFVRYFWPLVEPGRPLAEGWALDAMCLHLEAVDAGRLNRLLITVPPGSMKSLLCSVFFPLWQWGPRDKPDRRFLNFAYAAHLTQRDNNRMGQILKSPEWRELWGPRREKIDGKLYERGFSMIRDGMEMLMTDKTGWKFATSVGGVGTGERGDCVILDDPHSIKDDKSEVVRPETVRWFKEAMQNRLNDLDKSSIITIMQRTHEADVAGTILDEDMDYCHLNIPAAYEADQHCTTFDIHGVQLWTDPRCVEGENYWEARLPPKEFARLQKPQNAHMWVSQYQQRPEPRGGAIIKRDYWQPYAVPTSGPRKGRWPEFEYVVASIDGAFTEKQENDPQGFSIWGVWQNPEGSMCAILLNAWRKHLTLGGTKRVRDKQKAESWANYKAETEEYWGVVQWLRYECSRFKANCLLIENKANGHDIYNELLKHTQFDQWAMVLIDPKNLDKLARVNRVQPLFAEGLVYAIIEKDYAKTTIDEAAIFPNGRYDDITDSLTQALWYLRKNGYLEHIDDVMMREQRAREKAGKKPRGQKVLYAV